MLAMPLNPAKCRNKIKKIITTNLPILKKNMMVLIIFIIRLIFCFLTSSIHTRLIEYLYRHILV